MNWLILLAIVVADPTSEAVELETPTGKLFGVLDLPAKPGPWPVVLIHPGSGPTDRDGNQVGMKNDSLKQLGQSLAGQGIAALRIDKRGIAASAKALTKEADVRFTHYVDDAAAWLKKLKDDQRFSKVIALGHSEGSTIVILAAQKTPVDAVISLCGPGRKLSDILREQLAKNAKELAAEADKIITELEAGNQVSEPPKALRALFRPSVQPYLIDQFGYDPSQETAKLKMPLLIVSGTTDIQVPVLDAEKLQKAQPKAKHVSLKNMSHVLKETELTAPLLQQMAVYQNAKAPLHPKLVPEIVAFLAASLPKN